MMAWQRAFRAALSLGVSPGVSPGEFWSLSVREWQWLVERGGPDNALDREGLAALLKRFPDKKGRADD